MKRLFFLTIFLLCAGCVHAEKFWLDAEYLFWSIKKNPLPVPLLTKASFDDPLPGAIGQPGTHVLLGKDHVRMDWMNGFRVGAGGAPRPHWEIEGSYFLLPTVEKTKRFRTSGEPGSRNFAVPIYDVTGVCGLNGIPGQTIFILPGPLSDEPGFFGKFDFRISSRLQGADLIAGYLFLNPKDHFQLKGSGGFQWLQLHESLVFKAQTGTVPDVPFPLGFFNFSDRFSTWNDFLGAKLGLDGQYRRKKWKVDAEVSGALGAVLEQVKIKGSSRTSAGNLFFETKGTADATLHAGMFAEPSNRGTHDKSIFAYGFGARAKGAYKVVRHLEICVGYNFLWLSKVVRPGKQIDPKINSTRTALADASRSTVGTGPGPIPFGDSGGAPAASGPKKPRVHFKTQSFYAQGLDVGIALIF